MRSLTLILAALSTLALTGPAHALSECIAKDQIIEHLPADVHALKLSVDEAKELRDYLNGTYPAGTAPDLDGYSYVVAWMDSEEATQAVIYIFDEHNCGIDRTKRPKAAIAGYVGITGL